MPEEIFCPHCNVLTEHMTVKNGREHLVKCETCGAVHPIKQERTKFVNVRVIVSRENISQKYHIKVPEDERFYVGDELLVDDDLHDVVLAEITSIETERRVESVEASKIKTIWARAVDNVVVKVTLHKRSQTTSHAIYSSGDEIFSVGDIRRIDRTRFVVEKIKLRDGRSVKKAASKDVLRAWGRVL